jgi:peptide/nickel transport system permease protein
MTVNSTQLAGPLEQDVPALRSMRSIYLRAIGTRLTTGVPVFFLVMLAGTSLSNFMPGSAALTILGPYATRAQTAAFNAMYGYNQPLFVRYALWLWALVHGNLGSSIYNGQSEVSLLAARAPVTFEIALVTMLVSLVVAIPLALFTAMRPGGLTDSALRAISSFLLSIPSFVAVVFFGFVFALTLKWLPATGWVAFPADPLQNLRYVALPVMCLAINQVAYFYRVSRSEFAATLQEDFVLVARAKGLPIRYILLRHVLRPSQTHVLTVFGLSLSYLLGGSFIVENYFAVPGLGWQMVYAVEAHDLPTVQGILCVTVLLFIFIFMLVDIGNALIDPRVSVS